MSELAVAVEDIVVRYGKRVAVDGVSFQVPTGSVYALLGRNGAGKSSLVRAILGQLRPDRGQATLFGEDVWRNRARLMERVGVVPEEADAPPDMSVKDLGWLSSFERMRHVIRTADVAPLTLEEIFMAVVGEEKRP